MEPARSRSERAAASGDAPETPIAPREPLYRRIRRTLHGTSNILGPSTAESSLYVLRWRGPTGYNSANHDVVGGPEHEPTSPAAQINPRPRVPISLVLR